MNIKNKIIADYYIIFTRARKRNGVFKWLKRDFSHVYAMKKSPGGQFWSVINPLQGGLDIELLCVQDLPHARAFAGIDAIILPVRAYLDDKPRWTFCVFNCVEVVKALLGIRNFWIFTPYQLYKYLIKGN